MKTLTPNRQEILCYEALDNWEDMSLEAVDEFISKLKTPRLLALAEFLRNIKAHMESI